MAVGIGSEVGEATASYGMQTAVQLMESLIHVMEALAGRQNRFYRDPDTDRGLMILLQHAKDGGMICQSLIAKEDSDLFAQSLKEYHVPFVRVQEKGKEQSIFLTRDSDRASVEMAYHRFSLLSGIGMNEISAKEFIELSDRQDVTKISGLKPEEVELFRMKMTGREGTYSCLKEESGYALLFLKKDKEIMEKAFKDMVYELSGEAGDLYRKNLVTDLKLRDHFLSDAVPKDSSIQYIADAEWPNEFLAVTKDGFSLHSVQLLDGRYQDVEGKRIYEHDKLLGFVRQLKKPVVLTEQEMLFCQGIDRNGKAVLVEQRKVKELCDEVKSEVSHRPFYHGIRPRAIEKQEKIHTLSHLDADQISRLYTAVKEAGFLESVAITQDSVAYPATIAMEMNEILNNTVYRGLSDIEKVEDMVYYENRGDLHDLATPKYLLDVGNGRSGYTFEIREDSLTIYEKGKEMEVVSGLDRDITLVELYQSMEEPVVLSEEEMSDTEKRNEAIAERVQEHQHTDAKEYLETQDIHKKQELYEIKDGEDPKIERLDGRQKEAIRTVFDYEVKDLYIDRSLLEKVTMLDFHRRLEQHTVLTETQER